MRFLPWHVPSAHHREEVPCYVRISKLDFAWQCADSVQRDTHIESVETGREVVCDEELGGGKKSAGRRDVFVYY